MNEQTFVIIKPDAITRKLIGKIISRFEDMGLRIIRIEKRYKDTTWCERHYAHVLERCSFGTLDEQVYSRLEYFMSGEPLIGIILVGENAILRIKRMIGATNALDAMPGTIRGDWGQYSGCSNLVHASDSVELVQKEIELYFDKETDQ